jgi:hypothetical protein
VGGRVGTPAWPRAPSLEQPLNRPCSSRSTRGLLPNSDLTHPWLIEVLFLLLGSWRAAPAITLVSQKHVGTSTVTIRSVLDKFPCVGSTAMCRLLQTMADMAPSSQHPQQQKKFDPSPVYYNSHGGYRQLCYCTDRPRRLQWVKCCDHP